MEMAKLYTAVLAHTQHKSNNQQQILLANINKIDEKPQSIRKKKRKEVEKKKKKSASVWLHTF